LKPWTNQIKLHRIRIRLCQAITAKTATKSMIRKSTLSPRPTKKVARVKTKKTKIVERTKYQHQIENSATSNLQQQHRPMHPGTMVSNLWHPILGRRWLRIEIQLWDTERTGIKTSHQICRFCQLMDRRKLFQRGILGRRYWIQWTHKGSRSSITWAYRSNNYKFKCQSWKPNWNRLKMGTPPKDRPIASYSKNWRIKLIKWNQKSSRLRFSSRRSNILGMIMIKLNRKLISCWLYPMQSAKTSTSPINRTCPCNHPTKIPKAPTNPEKETSIHPTSCPPLPAITKPTGPSRKSHQSK